MDIRSKKWLRPLCIVVAVLLVLGVIGMIVSNYLRYPGIYKDPVSSEKIETRKDYVLIAHRGLSCAAPENTIPAFEEAGKAGFEYAECDIQLTKDEVWVVSHDTNLKRMTGFDGEIADMKLKEVRSHPVTHGSHASKYDNVVTPTLEEYLQTCQDYGLTPVIELREDHADWPYETLLDLLTQYSFRETAILISFHEADLKAVRKLDEDIFMMYLTNEEITEETADLVHEIGNCGIDASYKSLTKTSEDILKALRKAEIEVAVWTVDSPKKAANAVELGADWVTTNRITP